MNRIYMIFFHPFYPVILSKKTSELLLESYESRNHL
jgi:hypothetical protein